MRFKRQKSKKKKKKLEINDVLSKNVNDFKINMFNVAAATIQRTPYVQPSGKVANVV